MQKPGGSRQSNWVFSRVSEITNGNKAPGGFGIWQNKPIIIRIPSQPPKKRCLQRLSFVVFLQPPPSICVAFAIHKTVISSLKRPSATASTYTMPGEADLVTVFSPHTCTAVFGTENEICRRGPAECPLFNQRQLCVLEITMKGQAFDDNGTPVRTAPPRAPPLRCRPQQPRSDGQQYERHRH